MAMHFIHQFNMAGISGRNLSPISHNKVFMKIEHGRIDDRNQLQGSNTTCKSLGI